MSALTKFKDLLIESLKDNKKLIIGLYIILIILIAASWLLSGSVMESKISNLPAVNTTAQGIAGDNAVELFIHNELGGIQTYIFSIFFGIFAIVGLVYNAINLGLTGQMFSQIIPNGGLRFLVYLIPHGIFELSATIIESTAGILLFLFIWRFIKAWRSSETQGASDAFDKTKKILIQSLILMVFSTILLLIAAPIEAYFSVPFSQFVLGA